MGVWGKGLAFEAPFPTQRLEKQQELPDTSIAEDQVCFSSLLSVLLVFVLRIDSPRSSMR